jgi:hypothetical protein
LLAISACSGVPRDDGDDGVVVAGGKADAPGGLALGTFASADAQADFELVSFEPGWAFSRTSGSSVVVGTYELRLTSSGDTRLRFYDGNATLLDRYRYTVAGDGSLGLTNLYTGASFTMAPSPANEPYEVSFQAGHRDASGDYLGGTELQNLVGHDHRLYAGVGYDLDTQITMVNPPDTAPGPQILVLDSPHGEWRQDVAFSDLNPTTQQRRYRRLTALQELTFETMQQADGSVVELPSPVSILMAGLTTLYDDAEPAAVFVRDDTTNQWVETAFPEQWGTVLDGVRAIGQFRDPVTGLDRVFIGGRPNDASQPSALFSGVYDPSLPGKIRWDANPEFTGFETRAMAFPVINQSLYFAAKPAVFKRTTNGDQPAWQAVYTYPMPPEPFSAGLRGLTTLPGLDGTGEIMLGGMEGTPGQMLRFTDEDPGHPVEELDIDQLLLTEIGPPLARNVLSAYNDVVRTVDPVNGSPVFLIGLFVHKLPVAVEDDAWFLSRTLDARYTLHRVPHFDRPEAFPAPGPLRGVRSITVSPFSEDAGQVLYLGGFDTNVQSCHDSAWLYRVGISVGLQPNTMPDASPSSQR